MLRGALNVAHDVAIEAGADMATVLDDRFHPYAVVLVPPGSSVTGYTLAPGVLMLSVTPGPARLESLVVLA